MNISKSFLVAILSLYLTHSAAAESFVFNSGNNGIQGQVSATLTSGGFAMTVDAGPVGATLDDIDAQGMGINSRGINGAVDEDATKFNIIEGNNPVSGQGEFAQFSFNRAGILTAIDFDGVKDETFEYFRLDTGTGVPIFFFDSQADPAGINVPGDVIFLQETATLDDEISGLSLPFAAGQTWTLSYGQLGAGNGSRWEGLTVTVPEPETWSLIVLAIGILTMALRRQGK